ncbi:MAG: hypothetical protein QI197_04820 [Candidatus Korarchaeota archaeon]|nr:hypothetical protein [Candidatus Korarchaeota archaeon]
MLASSRNKVTRLLSLLGLALLILSSLQPWVVMYPPSKGMRTFTILEFLRSLSTIQADYGIIDGSSGLLYMTLTLLIVALLAAAASAIWSPLSLLAGGTGLLCAGFWMATLWIFRLRLESVGGRGLAVTVGLGLGPALLIVGSLILLASFVLSIHLGLSSQEGPSPPLS